MQGGTLNSQPSTFNQAERLAGPRLALQAIQRAFGLLQGDAWNGLQVEPHPLVVIRALRRRHLSPLQPPLKGHPGFSGNLLHCNMFG